MVEGCSCPMGGCPSNTFGPLCPPWRSVGAPGLKGRQAPALGQPVLDERGWLELSESCLGEKKLVELASHGLRLDLRTCLGISYVLIRDMQVLKFLTAWVTMQPRPATKWGRRPMCLPWRQRSCLKFGSLRPPSLSFSLSPSRSLFLEGAEHVNSCVWLLYDLTCKGNSA